MRLSPSDRELLQEAVQKQVESEKTMSGWERMIKLSKKIGLNKKFISEIQDDYSCIKNELIPI